MDSPINNALNQNRLKWINLGIVFYFVALYAIFALQLDHVIIGFITELFTIPALLAQVVFLIISFKFLLKKEETAKTGTKISIALLAICTLVTIGSFF